MKISPILFKHSYKIICNCAQAQITEKQNLWNKAMSKVRISVEWFIRDIENHLKFFPFHKNVSSVKFCESKFNLSVVGKMYTACVLLQNAKNTMVLLLQGILV